MLRENYESAYQWQRKQHVVDGAFTEDDKRLLEKNASNIVRETGISMYEIRKRLANRYDRAIENNALHEAIDEGIRQDWLGCCQPKRYNQDSGLVDRNVVLTEKGFGVIFENGFQAVMTMTHSVYLPKPEEKK